MPHLDAEQAKAIYALGDEAVVFALLELAIQLAEARSPSASSSTPSGMIPVYQKLAAKVRRKNKAGARSGMF